MVERVTADPEVCGSNPAKVQLRIGNNTTLLLIVTQVNGGSVVGMDKYILKMHLQIGDALRTLHNDQLVYSNRQDIALTCLTGFQLWLVHNYQTEEDLLNNKIITASSSLFCVMPVHYLI